MKAIAFAIICAAYLHLPKDRLDAMIPSDRAINVLAFLACVIGFWLCIFLERQ